MELLDYLSDEDRLTINEFITSYADCKPESLELVLDSWNKNKRKMFKALGKKLRVKIPINLKLDSQLYYRKIVEIYQPINFDTVDCCLYEKNLLSEYGEVSKNHIFMLNLAEFIFNKTAIFPKSFKTNLTELFNYNSIESGFCQKDFIFKKWTTEKELKIPKNTKIIKAIQKVLFFMEYDNMELFEKWKNALSNLSVQKEVKANLVFSIHPIDFLTMSDNNCGWQSCMSWMKHGSYSTGTIEMLNSNMVIMCYLESSKNFSFNNHEIPNKSWRCLLYVHKNIIVTGKPYPYYNKQINIKALKEIQKLLKQNLNWTYQYKYQEYRDLTHYYKNWYVRNCLNISQSSLKKNCKNKKRHSILLYTYGMYNDLIEDPHTKYWCCRNYVDHTIKISASGKATCMSCGQYIDTDMNIEDSFLKSFGNKKYCSSCESEKYCVCCHQVGSHETYYNIPVRQFFDRETAFSLPVGEKCLSEYVYDIDHNFFIHVDKIKMIKKINFIKVKEVKDIDRYKVSYSL